MENSRFVRCGEIGIDSDVYDVVCDTKSGDCILRDEVNGDYVISEITAMNPIYMTSQACKKICNELQVTGVIATDNYFYVVKEGIVRALEYGSNIAKAEFALNYDIVYEGEIDE